MDLWLKTSIGLTKEDIMDAIAQTCTSEEIAAFGLADGPLAMKIPLDPGVAAVGKAVVSELSNGAVEEPITDGWIISERAYKNKSPDSQEVLVPGDFLSCMKHSTQEKETSSSADLSAADKEMIKNWPKVLEQKKLCQDMAKDFPGLPQSAKDLLRAKVGLETKVMIFVKWLDLREKLKRKRANLKLQQKLWKGSKKSYFDQRLKRKKISELEQHIQGLWNSSGSAVEWWTSNGRKNFTHALQALQKKDLSKRSLQNV